MLNLKPAFPFIETKIITLTPNECARLLKKNNHNRASSNQTIRLYADQMKSGSWRLNGEPIIIATNGDVIDGQHRLYACIESGVSFETLIVFNIDRDCFATIDTGKPRNGADVLTINGLSGETARICSTAAGMCITFEKSGKIYSSRQNSYLVTPEKRAEWVKKNQRVIIIAQTIISSGRPARIIGGGESAFLWFYMEKKNRDCTYDFFDGFFSGANLGEKDPRLVLRQRLESFRNYNRKLTREAKLGAVIRSWDWFCRGKEVLYPNNMLRDFDSAFDLLK